MVYIAMPSSTHDDGIFQPRVFKSGRQQKSDIYSKFAASV
jgi:hypothetical protein